MKSAEVTDALINAIRSEKYGFIRCNYPNGDMVGHTGSMEATIIGVESVDLALSRLLPVIDEKNAILLITADHGNADEMIEKTKKGALQPRTAHSLNPVPFIVYGVDAEIAERENMGLANVASTVVKLMGYEAPKSWEPSIIK